jgi:disulfide bond formation protein DsbB
MRDEQIALLAGTAALALVLGALGFQYVGHLAPCEMCHWQRWPHVAAILVALAAQPVWKWDRRMTAIAALALVALFALMITGQWQFWFAVAIITIALGVIAYFNPGARGLAMLAVLLLALSGLIGLYQAGMQIGLLPGPSACTVAHPYIMGSNAPPPEVSCNAVTWSLFGLSLAAYNALVSLGTAALCAILLVRNRP